VLPPLVLFPLLVLLEQHLLVQFLDVLQVQLLLFLLQNAQLVALERFLKRFGALWVRVVVNHRFAPFD